MPYTIPASGFGKPLQCIRRVAPPRVHEAIADQAELPQTSTLRIKPLAGLRDGRALRRMVPSHSTNHGPAPLVAIGALAHYRKLDVLEGAWLFNLPSDMRLADRVQ